MCSFCGSYARTYCEITFFKPTFQSKCEKYWPDKGSERYGDVEVTLMKTEEFAYYITHTLQIKKVRKKS